MRMAELLDLGQAPMRLIDGSFGLIIQWTDTQVGVQVPGEEDIRWIDAAKVEDQGHGALLEKEKADEPGS